MNESSASISTVIPSSTSSKKKKEIPKQIHDKDLKYKLVIRVYGAGLNKTNSHGYCVDDTPSGISAPVGELVVDVRQLTLTQLRPMIQFDRTGHMLRRHPIFQEVLFIMSRLPNMYNRPKEELNKYQFGFVRKNGQEVKLLHPSRENEAIVNLIGVTDFFDHDLIIVPLSQISPELQQNIKPVSPSEKKRMKSSKKNLLLDNNTDNNNNNEDL